jgi:hypothetical protein
MTTKPSIDRSDWILSEKSWLWASIGFAFLTFNFVIIAAAVVLRTPFEDRFIIIQLWQPFVGFLLAITTFTTIVWRGLISARQANLQLQATNLQREQVDKLSAQIAMTEENNIARLLQECGSMISDISQQSATAAGIAILQTVAESLNGKFAQPVMNLLADFVQRHGRNTHENMLVKGAITTMDAIFASTKEVADRAISFDEPESDDVYDDDYETLWTRFKSARLVQYSNGKFVNTDLTDYMREGVRYYRTEFYACTFGVYRNLSFFSCTFERCEFKRIDAFAFTEHKFRDCNFSGVELFNIKYLPDLKSHNIWVDPQNPPIVIDAGENDGPVNWAQYFNFEDQSDDIPF